MNYFFDLFFLILKIAIIVLAPFAIMIAFFYIKKYLTGARMMPNTSYFPVKRKSFFKRLLWDFPKQYVSDLYNRNPDEFKDYGFKVITGKQGSGKSTLLTYLLLKYKKEYPKCKIGTNYGYIHEDFEIKDWHDLMPTPERSNGIYGRVLVLDEIQNYFSTNDSRNFNPAVLQEITQQRKQRTTILSTTQIFNRLSKQLREQCYILMSPFTICGCLTVVREYDLTLTEDATIDKKKLRKLWFFVHNDELRNAFDTYKKIELYDKVGFIPVNEEQNNINVTIQPQLTKSKRSKKEK